METFLDLTYIYPVTVINDENISVQETQTSEIITTRLDTQRWLITTALKPVFGTSADAGRLLAHKTRYSWHTDFDFQCPVNTNYRIPKNHPLFRTVGSRNAGTNKIILSPATDGILRGVIEGAFIKFANHSKVYLIDSVKIGSTVEWTVFPTLRMNVPSNTVVTVNPIMKARYHTNTPMGITHDGQGFIRQVISVAEAI